MLEDLEIQEVKQVAPEKMKRKREELPSPLAAAFDATAIGEARTVTLKPKTNVPVELVAEWLLRLLTLFAKACGFVACMAKATVTEDGVELYWQKKAGRKPQPAIQAAPEGGGKD